MPSLTGDTASLARGSQFDVSLSPEHEHYELHSIYPEYLEDTADVREFSLPPVDQGKDAWLCLMGGFFLEVMVWGFPFSFGVFQDYYTEHEPFSQDSSAVSLIGSCCLGIMYLASPISMYILQTWPKICRQSSLFGLVITCIGIVASSFATRVWQLIITQGIIYAIGACMLYYPILVFIDQWFVRRKGLAFGICWTGSGIAGVTFPFIIKASLSNFSYKTTIWAWTVIMAILGASLLPFVKPRIKVSSSSSHHPQRVSFSFLRSWSFAIFQMMNLVQSLGFFAPSLYLPTYARSILGESGIETTVPVTVMNAGMAIGMVLIGILIDRWHVTTVICLAAACTALAVFVIWGLSVSLPPLCVFALIYGVFAGSASATWPGIARTVRTTDEVVPTGSVIGILSIGRGIGSIACGPISAALIKGDWPWLSKFPVVGYGTNFGALIIFTGVTALVGTIGSGAHRLGFIQ